MQDSGLKQWNDDKLLNAWTAGEAGAGEVLYGRYFDVVYRFFRFKAPDAVEDLTQTTMETLHEKYDRFRGDGSFRGFVLGIARFVLLHHLRTRYREHVELDPEHQSHEDLDPGPFEVLAAQQDYRLLVRALRRIPIDHQIVLELHYWEGLTSEEIGVVLDEPPSTIRNRRKRARTMLRRQLDALVSCPQEVESTLIGLQTWVEELKKLVDRSVRKTPRRRRSRQRTVASSAPPAGG